MGRFLKSCLGIAVAVVLMLLVGGWLLLRHSSASVWDWTWVDPLAEVVWQSTPNDSVAVIVEPAVAPITEPVTIRVENLTPGQEIGIRSEAVDELGQIWQASGLWIADSNGVVDLTRDAAEIATYEGVEPMGLFWSMRPIEETDNTFFVRNDASYLVKISAEIDNETVAFASATRVNYPPNLVEENVDENGLRGIFFYPNSAGPHPTILLLGGSEGGFNRPSAAAWASQGYAVLTLGYHGIDSMPEFLLEIPLETFSNALAWLQAHDAVDPDRIAISGVSRGSEAALLTATAHPEINAVIALVPSSMVWSGIDFSGGEPKSAWTRNGDPLPFNTTRSDLNIWLTRFGRPGALTPSFETAMATAPSDTMIPVEQIEAPILLISGDSDSLWPSATFANQIEARLQANQFVYPVENHIFADAGHLMRIDYMPPGQIFGTLNLGGTRVGNAHAGAEAWQIQLDFLEAHLGK